MGSSKKRGKVGPQKRYAAHNYLFFSFAFAFILTAPFFFFDLPLSSLAGFGVATVYIFVPAGVTLLIYNKTLMDRIELAIQPNRGFLLAIFLPLALGGMALWVSTLLGETGFSLGLEEVIARLPEEQRPASGSGSPFWGAAAQSLLAGFSINAFFALGEELGWRGLLFNEWIKSGFWKLSLLTGLCWGLWWAPLVALGQHYPGYPLEGVALILAWAILASPLLTWVRILGRSVAATALMRGLLVSVSGISVLPLVHASPLGSGMMGIAGLLVLALADVLLLIGLKVKPLGLPERH